MIARWLIVAVCGCLVSNNALAMQQAILVQNSGWMEPFYSDPKSDFKPLIIATINAVISNGDVVSVLAFNQSTPENESPKLLYSGTSIRDASNAVTGIELAHKESGRTLADTDFNEAVYKTITKSFESRPGILWIFTNNKNSPNNNPDTVARNREFYRLVHDEQVIKRSLAFPLSMPVKGNIYAAKGLMLYALAYGDEADIYLQSLVASGRLKRIFTQQPAQLKPLDHDPIRLVPKTIVNAPSASASLGADGHTIILDIDVSNRRPVVQMVAEMENIFYPYRIEAAEIKAQIAGQGWESALPVVPRKLASLSPGETAEVTVSIPMQTEFPNPWSPSSLLLFGRQLIVPAVLRIILDGQKLSIDDAFRARLQKLFPGDPLPDVFQPPQTIKTSVAEIPLQIRVNYPLYPLLIAIGLLLVAIASGILFLRRGRMVTSYQMSVDGVPRHIGLGRFSELSILDASGQQVATVRRRGGTPIVASVANGHIVRILK